MNTAQPCGLDFGLQMVGPVTAGADSGKKARMPAIAVFTFMVIVGAEPAERCDHLVARQHGCRLCLRGAGARDQEENRRGKSHRALLIWNAQASNKQAQV